ncbi:sensor histidine kinase [Halomonas sp. WWR20]
MKQRLRARLTPPAHWSLGRRLLTAALILVLIILPLVGVGLAYNFRAAVTASFDQRLTSLLYALLADVELSPASQQVKVTDSLGDSRFERVFSGWYWQVTDTHGTTLVSRSLWDQRLPVSQGSEITLRNLRGPRDEPLRLIEREVHLSGYPYPLHISVAASREQLDTEVAHFQWLLAFSLLVLAILLLSGLALQIRWGLAPLRRMLVNLEAVEAGQAERLETRLPSELRELASAMNEVLERDRRLITRGRAAAGNLAHALKTPISVLQTLADRMPEAQRHQVRQEVARLDEAIRHHLARASAASGAQLAGRVRFSHVIAPVVDGLARLAGRRNIRLERHIDEALDVRMDPQDLQELVGNLLDNALRWADGRVVLAIAAEEEGVGLSIEDDGPGMTAAQREAALARGARLDERRSGSGLGLAIVEELVTLYGGRITLGQASLGGLSVYVWLPAAGAVSRKN